MVCKPRQGDSPQHRLTLGAVLLAAGSGSRMGHRPKSLLERDGMALIRRQILALSGAGVDDLVVVLGHYAQRIVLALQELPGTVVHNPDPDAGQVSSLRLGLRAQSPTIDTVLVALADQPLIDTQDIIDLIGAYQMRPNGMLVLQPDVGGVPGNPVLFSAEVRAQILAGATHMGCKQWQAAHPQAVYRWPTPNTRYCTDVDTQEDIYALAARTGHHLRWPADLTQDLD
ncbi:MAG: nucleotidyltransferase family protein [Rhodoferax sp.]|nr:nucleotidyltransferase family protein [Rhodoferax sp.]